MFANYFTVYFRRTIKFDARVANLILYYSNVNVLRNDNNVARVKWKRIETSICSIINIELSTPIFGLLWLYLKFKLSSQKTLFVPRDNVIFHCITDEKYPDVELPLKLLLFHVLISRPYDVCPRAASAHAVALASVMRNFNNQIDRKNLNFGNKTAI